MKENYVPLKQGRSAAALVTPVSVKKKANELEAQQRRCVCVRVCVCVASHGLLHTHPAQAAALHTARARCSMAAADRLIAVCCCRLCRELLAAIEGAEDPLPAWLK